MTDRPDTPGADRKPPIPDRYPDGSYPDFEDDMEDLEYLFESLRRLTF
jgi:hypothetical protein